MFYPSLQLWEALSNKCSNPSLIRPQVESGSLAWDLQSSNGITSCKHNMQCTWGCLHTDQAFTLVPTIAKHCSYTLLEATFTWPEFYAWKMGHLVFLCRRWYFYVTLGQQETEANKQFQGMCMCCACLWVKSLTLISSVLLVKSSRCLKS